MAEPNSRKQLLICEPDRGLRAALELALGRRYELVLAENPAEMMLLLDSHPIQLVIWDLDRPAGSLESTLKAVHAGETPAILRSRLGTDPSIVLDTLKAIRMARPTLTALLIAVQFDLDFQEAVVRECRLISFLTKRPRFAEHLIETVEILLHDRHASVIDRIVRMSIWRG